MIDIIKRLCAIDAIGQLLFRNAAEAAMLEYQAEEAARERREIAEWKLRNDPYLCSRCHGRSQFTRYIWGDEECKRLARQWQRPERFRRENCAYSGCDLSCEMHKAEGPFWNRCGQMTVDSAGNPICWHCVGLYGLAYDHRVRWNPETKRTQEHEVSGLDPEQVSGSGLTLPLVGL